MTTPRPQIEGVSIDIPVRAEYEQILTPEAVAFLAELHDRFDARRKHLLENRAIRQQAIDAGKLPDFLPETEGIRKADWKVAPIPNDLQDRRVEITGPVDRKMIINALNSGANVFMADFEDSNSPTWDNNLSGQVNLRDAVRGDIRYTSPEGKEYALGPNPAVLLVRPRGWHLEERHITVHGSPLSGSLMDFGLYFFHNARALMAKGTGPYCGTMFSFSLRSASGFRRARYARRC
jgi:malate synthase